jgi:5-carboxymethyl-2-hydroxymuconate isomerase
MPHLTLEYSSNIKEEKGLRPLFQRLHNILVQIAKARLEDCKSRAVEHKQFYLGNGGSENAFVHVEILLAEGRSVKVRQEIGKKTLEVLESHFSQSLEDLNFQITIEIKEFPRKFYFKIPQGTV